MYGTTHLNLCQLEYLVFIFDVPLASQCGIIDKCNHRQYSQHISFSLSDVLLSEQIAKRKFTHIKKGYEGFLNYI